MFRSSLPVEQTVPLIVQLGPYLALNQRSARYLFLPPPDSANDCPRTVCWRARALKLSALSSELKSHLAATTRRLVLGEFLQNFCLLVFGEF